MKNQPNHRRTQPRHAVLAAALALGLMATIPAFAQSTNATLKGQVAAGATVTATNVETGFRRTVQAAPNGTYALTGLPPGTYSVTLGTGEPQTVTLAVAQIGTLNAGAEPSATAGTVDAKSVGKVRVTGRALRETRTSESSTYVTQKQIQALPQGTRNFLAFADGVPGVQFTQGADGSTQLRSGAQSAQGVNVFIDGVGQKNYVLQGGITGQDSSRGNPFPQSAIGQYKVITQNYKAEFDQISAAAIVATTRSGSNKFTGDIFFDRTTSDWREATQAEAKSGKKASMHESQYGISLGGPIIQDKLHFFVAYEAKDYKSPRSFNPGQGYTVATLPDVFGDQLSDAYSAPFHQDMYFGKLTFAPNERNFFELSGRLREESETTGVGGNALPSAATFKEQTERRFDLRHQYTNGPWLNDAHATYEYAFFNPRPANFANGYVLTGKTWNDVIARGGGGRDFQNKGQKGIGLQNDLTFTGIEGHVIKGGVKYKDITVDAQEMQPYNPQFYYGVDKSLTIPVHVQFGSGLAGLSAGSATSKLKQFGIYLQDDWTVNQHLTLNLGMRWDYERIPGYLDYVTPADVVSALRNNPNLNAPNTGFDVNDYISTGKERKAFTGAFQPRVGFSYDLNADQRHVIFGGAGRAYNRNIFDYLQLEVTKSTFPTYNFDFNSSINTCTLSSSCLQWDPKYFDEANLRALANSTGMGREVFVLNNDMKTPYSDQFSLGMRNALGDWLSEVTVSRINSKDGMVYLLGNRRENGDFFAPGSTWGPPWGQGFAPLGNLIIGTNGIETKANSLMLKMDKPYNRNDGWGVNIAYTFTDAEENRQFGEVFALDYPNLEGFGWHAAGGVPKHRLVASGIYDAPWAITLSAKLTMESQRPRYGTNCLAGWNLCKVDQYTPSGSIGYKRFDLAAQKEFDLNPLRLRVRLDVLNVFNWTNWTGYDDWFGAPNEPSASFGRATGQDFQTRMVKLSGGISW